MERPILNQKLERVSPMQFGAVADGKTNDSAAILEAVKVAQKEGKLLVLPEGEYYVDQIIVLNNINVLSENAKILFYGMECSKPAVLMQDNVNIFGTIRIWIVDNTKDGTVNHGGRCNMGFGDYDDGAGAHHCYVENVEVTGGYENQNGILMTGDTSDVLIDRVYTPNGENYGRVVLLHWGNAKDHFPIGEWSVENGYGHVDGWKPTQFPHDIKIGLIEGENVGTAIDKKYQSEGAFHIAAGYNIEVDEIRFHNCGAAMCITGGDCGFEYGTDADKAHKQSNIRIHKIFATKVRFAAIYHVGYMLMDKTKSVDTDVIVDELYAEASTATVALITYSAKHFEVKKATLKGFTNYALLVDGENRNVKIGTMNLENGSPNAAIFLEHTGKLGRPDKLTIDTLNLKNCKNEKAAIINVRQGAELKVGTINAENVCAKSVLALEKGNDFDSICVDTVNLQDVEGMQAMVDVQAAVATDRKVRIGAINADLPVTMGESCDVKVG